MKKASILLIALMVISVGFLSGCTDSQTGLQTINPPELTEPEESFKASCIPFNYEALDANPSAYKGVKVTYKGIVKQTLDWDNSYRIDIGNGNEIYVTTGNDLAFVENNAVQIWGEFLGSRTYESVAGWRITLPHIWAFFIEELYQQMELGYYAEWGSLKITVVSAERVNFYTWEGSSGNIYDEWANDGEDFIIIIVSARYEGTESEYISSSDFGLVDSDGYKYSRELHGTLESARLYQGEKANGKVLFEVPESASGLKVQFNFGTSYSPLLAEWPLDI